MEKLTQPSPVLGGVRSSRSSKFYCVAIYKGSINLVIISAQNDDDDDDDDRCGISILTYSLTGFGYLDDQQQQQQVQLEKVTEAAMDNEIFLGWTGYKKMLGVLDPDALSVGRMIFLFQ